MRLSRPVYECLPVIYMLIGAAAIFLCYLEPIGLAGKIAFTIGFVAEIAALTLVLHRHNHRALRREYRGGDL